MKNIKKKYGVGPECPKKRNIHGWVNLFGARYTSPKACNSSVKEDKLLYNHLIAK